MKNMAFNVNSHIDLMLLPPPPPQNVKISKEKLSLKEFLRKVLFPRKKKPRTKTMPTCTAGSRTLSGSVWGGSFSIS